MNKKEIERQDVTHRHTRTSIHLGNLITLLHGHQKIYNSTILMDEMYFDYAIHSSYMNEIRCGYVNVPYKDSFGLYVDHIGHQPSRDFSSYIAWTASEKKFADHNMVRSHSFMCTNTRKYTQQSYYIERNELTGWKVSKNKRACALNFYLPTIIRHNLKIAMNIIIWIKARGWVEWFSLHLFVIRNAPC